mmetsp:Transcript_52654/g.124619  ORF Transcript_52654/g.124619 Transcript_52654/m.124619 type:complete len:354 (-) Transcript_52654:286-1347(-)
MLQEPPADGVPSLVVGDARALLLGEDLALLLEAADHALDRRLEVHHPHHRLGVARGDERRFVAYVCDVRAGEARREGGHALRHLVEAVAQLDLLQVNLVDLEAAANVGLVDLDLPVEPARAEEGGVEDVGTVRPRQHHNPSQRVEPVHLDEELVEGVLALVVAASGEAALAARAADRVDLVDEHDRRRLLVGEAEHLAHKLRPVPQVLLDQLRPDDAQESRRCLVRHRLGEQRLAGAGRPVQDNPLGRLDANILVELRVCHGQLHRLLDLLDLSLEAADVRVGLERRLVDLHHRHQGVHVVREHPHDRKHLVVGEDGAARLEEVAVDERHDVHVVLRPDRRGHDRVVVVDHLL